MSDHEEAYHLLRTDIPEVLRELSRRSGIHWMELSWRFHRIKSHGNAPAPTDVNWIDDQNGDVYDGPTGQVGQYIGNVFDDF